MTMSSLSYSSLKGLQLSRCGKVCDIRLPEGLTKSEKQPRPFFTPSTKADSGHHENSSFAEAAAIVGENIDKLI